jgi:hypothetical protein
MAGALVANAIKNSVLVMLIILILHVAIVHNLAPVPVRNGPPRPQRTTPSATEPASGSAAAAAWPDVASPVASRGGGADDRDLLEYVFGGGGGGGRDPNSSSSSSSNLSHAGVVPAKSDAKQAPSSPPGLKPKPDDHHHGFSVVGTYDGESTMCGGALFDGCLEGFDGHSLSSYQAL